MRTTVIWLAGRSGRLGRALEELLSKRTDIRLLVSDINDIDVIKLQDVKYFADSFHPDWIINCATRNNRKWCEDHPDEARRLHALGARNLAIASSLVDAHLIHLSSDFVFDGIHNACKNEFEPVSPKTIYGQSKVAGENFVRIFSKKHTIIRSSWLYGKKTLESVIEEAKTKGFVSVSQPIYGAPTSSLELAERVIELMEVKEYGTFHMSCLGECSQREFFQAILDHLSIDVPIVDGDEVSDFEFLRPKFSLLDNMMVRLTGLRDFPHWKEALDRFMDLRQVGKRFL